MLEPITMVAQLGLAAVLGGAIGYEREGLKRPAGFRTHILVCVGSTVAVHTNLQLLASFDGPLDPARLGAQVISGLGFLGAGTIIKEGNSVKGLTTAASLWVVGIIGLAVGAGQYFSAVISTILLYLILSAFRNLEDRIMQKKGHSTIGLTYQTDEKNAHLIKLALSSRQCKIVRLKKRFANEKITKVVLTVQHPMDVNDIDIMMALSELPFVLSANAGGVSDKDKPEDYNID